MELHHLILFYHLAALVCGDVLLDFTEKSLEQLPNWIQENVDDSFPMDNPFYFTRRVGFMAFDLKHWNVTANGMKGIRLLEKPIISGSLFDGSLTLNLTTIVDLSLSGKYNATGNLFPFVEDVPFSSIGNWSADATVISNQLHYVTMNVSLSGSITLVSEYQYNYKPETTISNYYFDNFLEDYLGEWYYPILKEGFGEDLETRAHLSFLHDHIDVFGGFFQKTFKSINYFDLIER